MDSNRSLIALTAAVLLALVGFLGLLPAMMPGVRPDQVSRPMVWDEATEQEFEPGAPPPATAPPPPPARRAAILPPFSPYEEYVPRTEEEKRWASAYQKLESREREMKAEAESFDRWRGFIESDLGTKVQSAFELLRRGHGESAGQVLAGLLPELAAQPADVQQPVLAASIRLFKQVGDMKAMAGVLVAYLENLEKQLAESPEQGRDRETRAEMLAEVRRTLEAARGRAREVGG